MFVPLANGLPTFLSYTAGQPPGGTTDLYSWTPGKADSLVRLTRQIP